MKKRIVVFLFVAIAIVCVMVLRKLIFRTDADGSVAALHIAVLPQTSSWRETIPQNQDPSMPAPTVPIKAKRLNMSDADRIQLLEVLGCVPEDADMSDYILAENTSWWGKRLDSVEFWRYRIIWYDFAIEREARRRGRGYPPMPWVDTNILDRSDVDKQAGGFSIEARLPRYVASEREDVFWDRFIKTHPHPPDQIQDWLERNALRVAYYTHLLTKDPETAAKYRLTKDDLNRESDLRDAETFFFPPECVSSEAYHWAYVMKKRREYDAFLTNGRAAYPVVVSNFFKEVYVDHSLITEPLTPEQIKAANVWKVKYLRRLRAEKWDESYISAYKQAWNLSEEDLTETSPTL